MRAVNLSAEMATEWYNSTDERLKKLAIETYPELVKKELPKTWEELETINGYYLGYGSCPINASDFKIIDGNKNIFKTKNQAEAAVALAQLSQLKAVYNGDWFCDWGNTNQIKWNIVAYLNDFQINYTYCYPKFLAFKDHETAKLFLENFRELITKAKPLFS